MRIRGKAFWAGMTAFTLLFTGCAFSGLSETEKNPPLASGPTANSGTVMEEVGEVHYYRADETVLPDLKKEYQRLIEENWWCNSGWNDSEEFQMAGDRIYHPFSIFRSMDEEERAEARLGEDEFQSVHCGAYIQYLEPPYDTCETIRLDRKWEEGVAWEEQRLRVTKDGRMLVLLKREGTDEEAVGEVREDGTCELLGTAEARELFENVKKELFEESEEYQKILKAGVSGKPVYAYRENGELYYTDARRLFRYEEEEPLQLLSYTNLDVAMDVIYCLKVTEDGFLVFGGYRGKYFLMKLTEVAEPVVIEKQEVVFEIGSSYPAIKDVVANFNRENKKYKVVFATSSGDYDRYKQDIQMQLAAGEGADILGNLFTDEEFRNLAENGYLASLDSLIGSKEDFFPGCLNAGIVNGVRYGMPVRGNVYFLAGGREIVGDRESWTTEEMMAAVEKSGAQWACVSWGSLLDGCTIVKEMGLRDNGNKDYIDWENGVSHLTEEPFLRLLEFAKKYMTQPKNGMHENNYGKPLREGKVALECVSPQTIFELQWRDECFEGKAAFIGYPKKEGSGVRFGTQNYYINASAKCPEGAREFLQYLLSDDAQTILTFDEWGTGVSVRRSILKENLESHLNRRRKMSGGQSEEAGTQIGGIMCQYHKLTKEEIERYLDLVERAEPSGFYADSIMGIVEEELAPYFAGERSAEEATRILDNRVQLYLNERK